MPQVSQGADDPVIAPARVLFRHSDYQGFNFRGNGRATWILPLLGAVELLGDEFSIPSQDSVGLSDTSNLAERFASQPLSNFSQGDSFPVRKTQSCWKLDPQYSILGGPVFVPQKELLVYGTRHVCQQS
jgi:hypothetical protein